MHSDVILLPFQAHRKGAGWEVEGLGLLSVPVWAASTPNGRLSWDTTTPVAPVQCLSADWPNQAISPALLPAPGRKSTCSVPLVLSTIYIASLWCAAAALGYFFCLHLVSLNQLPSLPAPTHLSRSLRLRNLLKFSTRDKMWYLCFCIWFISLHTEIFRSAYHTLNVQIFSMLAYD